MGTRWQATLALVLSTARWRAAAQGQAGLRRPHTRAENERQADRVAAEGADGRARFAARGHRRADTLGAGRRRHAECRDRRADTGRCTLYGIGCPGGALLARWRPARYGRAAVGLPLARRYAGLGC